MKSLLIGAILLLMVNVCSAHWISGTCWQNGKFTFNASAFPVGRTVTIKVTNGGASWDTSFVTTKSSFQFKVPQPNVATIRKVYVKCSDGWDQTYWTSADKCSTLPLKFESFKAEKISDTEVLLTVEVSDVYDVQKINFTASLNGKDFVVVGTIVPESGLYQKKYTATIDLSKPLNSTK